MIYMSVNAFLINHNTIVPYWQVFYNGINKTDKAVTISPFLRFQGDIPPFSLTKYLLSW